MFGVSLPLEKRSYRSYWILFVFLPANCAPYNVRGMGSVEYDKSASSNGRYPVNTRATVTCDPGYTHLGASSLTCSSSGSWNFRGSAPRCHGKKMKKYYKFYNCFKNTISGE